jgi:putative endonuclease
VPFDPVDWAQGAEATTQVERLNESVPTVVSDRRLRGRRNHLAGDSAEGIVERFYSERGAVVLARRWRGRSGEIDLICRDGEVVVIIEVKAARTFDAAMARISVAQVRRICAATSEFLSGLPSGELTEIRFDAALVDASGQLRIVENAFHAV